MQRGATEPGSMVKTTSNLHLQCIENSSGYGIDETAMSFSEHVAVVQKLGKHVNTVVCRSCATLHYGVLVQSRQLSSLLLLGHCLTRLISNFGEVIHSQLARFFSLFRPALHRKDFGQYLPLIVTITSQEQVIFKYPCLGSITDPYNRYSSNSLS